ncbi:exopolysaccharide production protein ExoZ [Humitalea rosea]|uniref:Exopolysaccharide production protein ExoZ n=1 Tax=Humitalea rosea TaxID=990373 RepID=A0A2W7JEP4_9PROT|nr:exopolysaccharide production protein ExoZ [Humitalea rosea]
MAPILSIQYLRAVAAMLVVFSHAGERAGVDFQIGAAGVDLFFVISGFIMWVVVRPAVTGGGAFLRLRLIRIVPLYWAVTLGLVAVASINHAWMPNFDTTPANLAMSLGFIPHFDPSGHIYPVLAVGWTLNYEIFFYLLFAASFALERARRLPALAAALLGLVAVGLVARPEGAIGVSVTDPIMLEFLAGLLLGEAWLRGRLPGAGMGYGLMLAGLAMAAAQHLGGWHSDAWRVLLWGVPALLLITGALAVEAAGQVPRLGWLRLLGDASYSIYLLHGPLVGPVMRLMPGAPVAVYFLAAAVVSAIAGIVCYWLLERPATRLLRRGVARAPRVATT